jgi:hypothetical protein
MASPEQPHLSNQSFVTGPKAPKKITLRVEAGAIGMSLDGQERLRGRFSWLEDGFTPLHLLVTPALPEEHSPGALRILRIRGRRPVH